MTPFIRKNISLILLLIGGFLSISQAQDNLSYNITFETAKSKLPQSVIDTLVNQLHTWQDYKIVLEGHTDNIGTAAYNQKLSLARVNEIKYILIDNEIESDRIITLASGASKPIADNNTVEGRAKNRRVDILLTTTPVLPTTATPVLDKALVLEKTKQLNDKLLTLISKRGLTHRINPKIKQTVVAKQGTRIIVPANAFDVPEGTKVLIKVTEVFRKSDMILQNLATVSNGHALETGGMIKIEAFADGAPIQLKEGMALDIEVPTKEVEDEMQLFASNVAEDGSINWVQPQPLARRTRYIAPSDLKWNISSKMEGLSVEPKEPLNPSFEKEPRPVDSSLYYQLKFRAKELRETPYKSYQNYKIVKGLFGKRKVKKSKKDSIGYLVTVQEMIKNVEGKITGQERRMQQHQETIETYNAYLKVLQVHKEWEDIRDSIYLKNLLIAAKHRNLNEMQFYSSPMKEEAYYKYWSEVYGISITDSRVYNATHFAAAEGDSLLCLKAIAEQDTLAVNMIRRQKYKERLMLSIYQTEVVEEAYIAHYKYRHYTKYKSIADKFNITIEKAIKKELIERKWKEDSRYLFQMANLGRYINCDFFPSIAPEELLVTTTLEVPNSIGITKTMMVFKNYNTVMTANIGIGPNSNQCSWRNIPLEEPVKIVSIYIDEMNQMQVAIQELNTQKTLSALEYKPMTEQEFLRALSKVNDIAAN
jgi:hypothetical protein